MYIEDSLGEWVSSLRWEDLPSSVREAARTCVMDGLSVGIAGTTTHAYDVAATAINELAGSAEGNCCVLGSSAKAEPTRAAWLNGVAMHALDFDDTSYAGIVHATAVVLPAVMAMAEQVDADFEDLLTAYVAGVEVELAIGAALGDSLYNKGHWATTALGIVGAATGAAKALGLTGAQTASTIRLALNTSFGTRSIHGSSAKPYLCGLAARLGIEAAIAVRAGLAAGTDTLAGRYGYAAVANDRCLDRSAFEGVGTRYRIVEPGMAIKLYPVCSAGQAAIQAVLELKSEFGIRPDDVIRIRVYATSLVVSCLVHARPRSTSQAQFSMQFAVATALLDDGVGVEHLSEAWIESEPLQSYLERIELFEDGDLVAEHDLGQYPEAARVEIELADRRRLERTVLAAKGMPVNPLGKEEAATKFRYCVGKIFTPDQASRLYQRLESATKGTALRGLLEGIGAFDGGARRDGL